MISLTYIANRLKFKSLRQWRHTAIARNQSGTAAVEFALIAPILIMLYLGLAELTLGMMASRRTSHLAATVGDLAAQSESLTTANINDIFDIGASMLAPFPVDGNLTLRLTAVKMSTANKAEVQWSDGRGATPYAKDEVISGVSVAQLPQGETLVLTEVTYDYQSPLSDLLPGITHFSDTFYHHPRTGGTVARK